MTTPVWDVDGYRAYTQDPKTPPSSNVTGIINQGLDLENLSLTAEQETEVRRMVVNAFHTSRNYAARYTDERITPILAHINEAFSSIHVAVTGITDEMNARGARLDSVERLLSTIETSVENVSNLTKEYKRQVDQIPAGAGQGIGGRLKVADPPTFSGSDNHASIEDWLNQILLYCTAIGNVTDNQKIITALTRLRAPAQKYVKSYFDKNRLNQDLGTWENFVKELTQLYGQRDDKEGAKKEITALWNNKNLAQKDFIKYAEQYRTLARLVDYEDIIHIDKLKNVLPAEVRTSMVTAEMFVPMPTKWDKYLEQAINIYKKLNPDKSIGAIFSGNKGNHSSGGKSTAKDPDAMEIDSADKSKKTSANTATTEKSKFCQICAGKGLKGKSKTHNTNDCWDKPGNEGNRPAPKTAASTSTGNTKGKEKQRQSPRKFATKKQWKAAIAELIGEMPSEDEGSSDGTPTINTLHASIEEVEDSEDVLSASTVQVASAQKGQSKKTTHTISDFVKDL